MNIEQFKENLSSVKAALGKLLKEVGYLDFGDLSYLEFTKGIPEENFIAQEADTIARLSNALYDKLDYLSLPIKEEGELEQLAGGELYLNGEPLRCGDILEVYCLDDSEDYYTWKITHVEHTEDRGYFLFGFSNCSIHGLPCRTR